MIARRMCSVRYVALVLSAVALIITASSLRASAFTFTAIDVPGATATEAFGINAAGDIVGFFTNASGAHGFLLSRGVFTTIDVPGATATEAVGINACPCAQGLVRDERRFTRGVCDHQGTIEPGEIGDRTGSRRRWRRSSRPHWHTHRLALNDPHDIFREQASPEVA